MCRLQHKLYFDRTGGQLSKTNAIVYVLNMPKIENTWKILFLNVDPGRRGLVEQLLIN